MAIYYSRQPQKLTYCSCKIPILDIFGRYKFIHMYMCIRNIRSNFQRGTPNCDWSTIPAPKSRVNGQLGPGSYGMLDG